MMISFAAKKKVFLFVKRQLQKKLYVISNFASSCPCLESVLCNLPEVPFFNEVAPLSHQLVTSSKEKLANNIQHTQTTDLRKMVNNANILEDSLLTNGMPQINSSNRNNTVFTETSFCTTNTETSEEASYNKKEKKLTSDEYQNVEHIRKSQGNSEVLIHGKNIKTEEKVDDFSDIRLSADHDIFISHEFLSHTAAQILCED
jgi:hypothetical protein